MTFRVVEGYHGRLYMFEGVCRAIRFLLMQQHTQRLIFIYKRLEGVHMVVHDGVCTDDTLSGHMTVGKHTACILKH